MRRLQNCSLHFFNYEKSSQPYHQKTKAIRMDMDVQP